MRCSSTYRNNSKVVDEGVENNVKRLGGQCLVRSWDCSRIENEEEEESCQERDQMAAQWHEEPKLDEILNEEG